MLFQPPAPTSLEVLEALALAVGPDEALAGSAFHVDPYSIAVGGKLPLGWELGGSMAPRRALTAGSAPEDTLEPPPAPGFPESVVAIMVVCVLVIITVPIVLLVVRVLSVCPSVCPLGGVMELRWQLGGWWARGLRCFTWIKEGLGRGPEVSRLSQRCTRVGVLQNNPKNPWGVGILEGGRLQCEQGPAAAWCSPPQVLRTRRGSWSDVAVLWDRRDPEVGTQTLEMENQGFWVASEQVSGLYGGGWSLRVVSGGSWRQVAVGALKSLQGSWWLGWGCSCVMPGSEGALSPPLGAGGRGGGPCCSPGGGHSHLLPSGHRGGFCVLADGLSTVREGAAGLKEARRDAAALSLLPLPCGMPAAPREGRRLWYNFLYKKL